MGLTLDTCDDYVSKILEIITTNSFKTLAKNFVLFIPALFFRTLMLAVNLVFTAIQVPQMALALILSPYLIYRDGWRDTLQLFGKHLDCVLSTAVTPFLLLAEADLFVTLALPAFFFWKSAKTISTLVVQSAEYSNQFAHEEPAQGSTDQNDVTQVHSAFPSLHTEETDEAANQEQYGHDDENAYQLGTPTTP